MQKGVSIILCCYNSAARLDETLLHISKQQTAQISCELIIVDNGSTDDTKMVASRRWRELNRTDISLSILDEPKQGLAYARKKGIDAARFSFLIFCDDDNHLFPNYVSDAFAIMSNDEKIGILGGNGIAKSDQALPAWFEKYKYCFACYPQGETDGELTHPLSSLYGAGMVLRKEVFEKLFSLNFTPQLTDRKGMHLSSGGDIELCYAIRLLGYKLWFSGKLSFFHFMPSGRLTEDYLLRLNDSLSYCSSNLIVYRYVLSNKKLDRWTWWKDITFQIFLLSRSLVRFLVLTEPLVERKLSLGFSYNSFKSILLQFRKYKTLYFDLLRLKSFS